ncbi:ScbA/BarX family gamma-butyrolactone biosynthesis protein [Streptomyces sp. NPDC058751]|uniref:ScbA/BarX family gamma-butyrolactone biosynthesis protein n=1 Tax=Streptomyces sp. NPDC058751 TaxID=3346623 RepID=UPI0036881207
MSVSTLHAGHAIPGATSATSTPAGAGALLPRPLTTTVPKELVHRASLAEVMLTGWEPAGGHRFAVSAQWPRGHRLFAADGRYHPLIAAETIRQAGILLAHTEYGVPLDRQLLVRDLRVHVRPEHLGIGWTPATLELRVDATPVARHGSTPAGLRVEVEIHREGRPAATGGATLAWAAPPAHPPLPPGRGRPRVIALTAPVPPHSAGRLSPADVVLSATGQEDRWRLRVDIEHPAFFDRPVGHVPAMMLLEAVCQSTAALLGRPCVPLGITTEFLRETALSSHCVIEACRVPGTGAAESVLVSGHQDAKPVFRSTVSVAAR